MQQHCLIQRQAEGLPLKSADDYKIEFQLRAKSGRAVISYDDEEKARKESIERNLTCFRVTHITEQL
jgi:hypothetical protein